MSYEFEHAQKYCKEQFDGVAAPAMWFSKTFQAIATETADYSKKSIEGGSALVEKLLAAKSYDSAMQIQSEYWKSSYAGFMTQATKMGELYSNLAKEALKPIETVLAKAQGGKN